MWAGVCPAGRSQLKEAAPLREAGIWRLISAAKVHETLRFAPLDGFRRHAS